MPRAAPSPEGIDAPTALPDDSKLPQTYPTGVVPREQLESLSAYPFPPAPPLANATPCRQRLLGDPGVEPPGCAWQLPSILAFHAGKNRVAFLDARDHNVLEGCFELEGITTPLEGATADDARSFATAKTDSCPQGTSVPQGTSEFLLQLQKEGYEGATNLIARQGFQGFGAWGYHPLAVLRAPLPGFLVQATANANKTRIELRLIAPDNRTIHALGTTPLATRTCVERNLKGACTKSTTEQMPSVWQVALAPDRRRIVVLLKLNTPEGHDTSASFRRLIFPVPRGVLEKPGASP